MHGRLAKLALAGSALAMSALLLTVDAPAAIAACGNSDDSFARMVAPYTDTVVLARVGVTRPSTNPRELGEFEAVTVQVLRVLSGRSETTLEVPASVLGDCTHPSGLGDRIVLAFVSSWPNGAFVGSWHEDHIGRWWHHFERHASLDALVRALNVLPDTAAIGDERAPAPTSNLSGPIIWLIISLGIGLLLERRRALRRGRVASS